MNIVFFYINFLVRKKMFFSQWLISLRCQRIKGATFGTKYSEMDKWNLRKTAFKTFKEHGLPLGQLKLLEVSRALLKWLQGHCKTGHNSETTCMTNILYFCMKNVQWQYLDYELWRNNNFYCIVGKIMSSKIKLKTEAKG